MEKSKRRIQGLGAHGSAAGLGLARGLTSHARHAYEEKYKPKYKRPSLIFAIDGVLLALVAALVVANVWIYTLPPAKTTNVKLTLVTPPIETVTPLAVEAKILLEGDEAHENVLLIWDIPSSVRVIQSTPSIGADGSVAIGRLEPGEEVKVTAILQVLTDEPSLRFGFRVRDDSGVHSGSVEKPVRGSGLAAKPIVDAASISVGASVPFVLQNSTPLDLENVSVRAIGNARVQDGSALSINELSSLEKRAFLFQPSAPGDGFEVYLGETKLYQVIPEFRVASNELWNRVDIRLAPSTGSSTTIFVDTPQPIELMVYHPGLRTEDGILRLDVDAEVESIPLAVDRFAEGAEWFVIPILRLNDQRLIGPAAVGAITTNFDVQAHARFYSRDGDQIGVGGLPPRANEETTFWVFASLEPTTADLRDFRAAINLPSGVTPTGKQSLPFGGGLVEEAGRVVWVVEYIPRSDQQIYAGFEVAVTPNETLIGGFIPLIESWNAEAVEIRSGVRLRASGGATDSSLPEDAYASGRGRVIR